MSMCVRALKMLLLGTLAVPDGTQPRVGSLVLAVHPEHNVTLLGALRGLEFWLLFVVRQTARPPRGTGA